MVKNVVGFSGGAASSVTAKIVRDMAGPESTVLLFHDTKTEPADNDRFRADVAKFLGMSITSDSDGRDIWQVFEDEGILGNGRNTPCSRILKQERSMAYMKANQPAILYIGFTAEETDRAQRTYARYFAQDIDVRFPLIEQGISKAECLHRVTNCWGLKLPQLYEWADHANCIPCVKGKKAYWGLMHKFERTAWERAAKAEEEFGHTIFTEAGSLRAELDDCLRLADLYLKKKKAKRDQRELFDFPCECAT
jgi:3'-phosphoadenosine 5'-phosphosulfate sulfotransferase (PAPS reductase)/FAD synthetase